MNYLFLRFRMNILFRKLNKYFQSSDFLDGDNLDQFIHNQKDLRALYALNKLNCVSIQFASDQIYAVYRGDQADLYLIQRSELWFNRICAYILGIISSFVVQWLIRIFLQSS